MAIGEQFFYLNNRIIDMRGLSVAATVSFYLTGTTSLRPIYADQSLETPLANPFNVNAGAAIPNLWLDPSITYRVRIVAITGEVISDYDPFDPINASSLLFVPAGAGAISRTIQDKLRESVSILDFGAIQGTDEANAAHNVTAIQAALNSGAACVFVPYGTYVINAALNIPKDVALVGDGWQKSQIKLASTAPDGTNIAVVGYGSTVRDMWFRGNWDSEGAYLVNVTTTDGSATITVNSGTVLAGQRIAARGVTPGTTVLSVGSGTAVLSSPVSGSHAGISALVAEGGAGAGLFCKDPNLGLGRFVTLENVAVDRCKSAGIYAYESAYNRFISVLSDTHGGDALYLEGSSSISSTTIEVSGESVFSTCAFGYGLRLKNCLNSRFSCVTEGTYGVALEGNGANLMFDNFYCESPSESAQYVFNTLSGGCNEVFVLNSYLGFNLTASNGVAVWQHDPNYTGITFVNCRNITGKPYVAGTHYTGYTILEAGKARRLRGAAFILASDFTTAGNVGTGEDVLYTKTIPGNTLSENGGTIEFKVVGKTAANANNKTAKIKFGGTTIFDTTALAANNKDWVLDVVIGRTSSTVQISTVSGFFNGAAVSPNNTALSLNLDNDLVLSVTGEGTADNDITVTGRVVKLVDPQDASL